MEINGEIMLRINFAVNPRGNFRNIPDLIEPCDIKCGRKQENIKNRIDILLGKNWEIIKTTQILGFSRAGEKLLVALKKQSAPDSDFISWPKLPKALEKNPGKIFLCKKLIILKQYPRMVDIVDTIQPELIKLLNQHLKKNEVNQEVKGLVILGW